MDIVIKIKIKMNIDNFVDFDEIDDSNTVNVVQNENSKIKKYDKRYNESTDFYRIMREQKCNFISHCPFDCDVSHVFQFHSMWDPYTGERTQPDPLGQFIFTQMI